MPSTPKSPGANTVVHLGTGNHFIELCLDESEQLWVMPHSGSRGIGGRGHAESFRAGRSKPGLLRQHLTAVRDRVSINQ